MIRSWHKALGLGDLGIFHWGGQLNIGLLLMSSTTGLSQQLGCRDVRTEEATLCW